MSLFTLVQLKFTENTSIANNNNNNHSLNNNTIKYSDKSTQTLECDECEASQNPASVKDEVKTAETQTDFTNLHSDSICCLSSIPYADMTNSPPPAPPPRRGQNKIVENCTENHQDENHSELNQLSARNLQLSIDTNVGETTQTTTVGGVSDNGNVPYKFKDDLKGENL